MKKIFKNFVRIYLKLMTKIALWRHKPEIIAIAGTENKTLTKEVLRDALKKDFDIRCNPKSYNTEIGLPLAVLYLESGLSSFWKWLMVLTKAKWIAFFGGKFPKKLILEMGVDKPWDMDYLLSIIHPRIAVITIIAPAHLDNFGTLGKITKEYERLVESIPDGGLVLLNLDNEITKSLAGKAKARVIFYGFDKDAEARIISLEKKGGRQEGYFLVDGEEKHFQTEKVGKHHIYALLISEILKRELKKN